MSYIAAHDSVPDIYSWHQIGAWEREPDTTIPDFNTLREKHGLPQRPIDVNEYAWPDEQHPAGSVFFLSQLERHNIRGLRANWGSGSGLHDTMANLLFKKDGNYQPNGEWYLYRYYAQMDGSRVSTHASSDRKFDVFATVSNNRAKILAGARSVPQSYEISVSSLSSLGLPEQGSVHIRTLQFNWSGKEADPGEPIDLGISQHTYSANKVSITNPSTFD